MNLGQPAWRWCTKCEGLFFASHPIRGVCPLDGLEHDDAESGEYLVMQEEAPDGGQDGWRWCRKCEGLFFDGDGAGGVCPAAPDPHDGSESGNYILHQMPNALVGQNEWRWCQKCAGIFFGGHTTIGECPAGGPHDGSASGDYRMRVPGDYLFDRPAFFNEYKTQFQEKLTASQNNGLSTLLGFMEHDADVTDLRWFAYMLATVKLECANTWMPIREFGCKDGRTPVCTPIPGNERKYGDPMPCPNSLLKPRQPCPAGQMTHTYYGRGYVQITHQNNYRRLGVSTGRSDHFVHVPDDVLDPSAAYAIMSVGMRQGLFTGKKLGDFINDTTLDYANARKIINPGDTATFSTIESHAQKLQAALEASLR